MEYSNLLVFGMQIAVLCGLLIVSASYGCLCWARRADPVFHLCVSVICLFWLIISRSDVRYLPDILAMIFESDFASIMWLAAAIWGICHLIWCLGLTWKQGVK